MRAVNQIISYDLPFVFAAIVPVLLTGSLKLSDIAAAQPDVLHWFVFYPVIGQLAFIAYIVATSPPRTGCLSISWRRSPS